MKTIITKRGDYGRTDCLYGMNPLKSSLIIECIGTLDEANAWIGIALKDWDYYKVDAKYIEEIQNNLVSIMGEISAHENFKRYKKDFPKAVLNKRDIIKIEKTIVKLEKDLELDGWSTPRSYWDVACRVVRRAERVLNKYNDNHWPVRPEVLIYINRLSDLLWIIAQQHNFYEH